MLFADGTTSISQSSPMATRLYVNAPANIIERLIGVPNGTTARLEEFNERTKSYDSYDQYQLRQLEPDLAKLEAFHVFGFGRFTRDAFNSLKAFKPSDASDEWLWCGSTSDQSAIGGILEDQLGNLVHDDLVAQIDSLSWS